MDLSKLSDEDLQLAVDLQKKYKIDSEFVPYALQVREASIKHGLNPDFVLPMVRAESGFNPNAESPKGAFGLMQLMPNTSSALKVDPKNIGQNIEGGMLLLKQLIANKNIGGDPAKVIAGFNANPAISFIKTGDVKDLPDETLKHINNILEFSGGTLSNPYITEKPPELTKSEKDNNTIEVSDEDFKEKLAQALVSPSTVAGAEIGAGLETGKALKNVYDKLTSLGNKVDGELTSGEKWYKNWAGQQRSGLGGVPEASSAYNRAKGQGPITSRMSKMYGPPKAPGEPNALLERLAQRRELSKVSPLTSIAQKTMSFPPVTGALAGGLGGYGAVKSAEEAQERFDMGDKLGATLAGMGAVGNAMAIVPTVPTRLVGSGMAIASPLALTVLENMRKQKELPPATPEELQQAQQPAFGMYPK
jgi:hypothetical protein